MTKKIKDCVIIEVDGCPISVDVDVLEMHVKRLESEGRDVKVIGKEEETPPLPPTKTQLVNACLDAGEEDIEAIAETCNCSIGLVKKVINKRG